MRKIKKFASLLLALVMAMAMTLPVMATDSNSRYTITVKQNKDDKTEHTYEAYQIFAGDLATVDGNKVLSNITWGKGVKGSELLAALKKDNTFGEGQNNVFYSCNTAADVAKILSGDSFESSTISTKTLTDAFAKRAEEFLAPGALSGSAKGTGNVSIGVPLPGYYLIKDKDDSVSTEGAYSRFMLQVVGNAEVNVKSDVPSGEKKVYKDPTTATDANNAFIGSHVSYEITSKVPNYIGYDHYYFVMNDTLSEGLTFDGVSSLSVQIGDTVLKQGVDYYVYTGEDAKIGDVQKTFRLAFKDIMEKDADGNYKYAVGAPIIVTYSATVNDKAVIGVEGNKNEWTLQYSNKPDESGRNDKDENHPGLPAEGPNHVIGETPKDITLTYVTELDITKYANSVAADHLLAGATFTLTGTSNQVVLKEVEYYEASANGTYYLLKDGTYTDEEPKGIEYVEIGVGTKDTKTGYIKVGDNYVVPEDTKEYEGKTLYKLIKGTATDYVDVNTKYEKKTKEETTLIPTKVSIEGTSGADGKIYFKGIGEGTYTLTETVTPEGFNTLDPIEVVINFKGPDKVNDGKEKCTWTMTWNGKEATTESGIFAQDVVNNSGSLLPSTGGIGTTIFYIVGAILVIGAGVILVVKKRMSNE